MQYHIHLVSHHILHTLTTVPIADVDGSKRGDHPVGHEVAARDAATWRRVAHAQRHVAAHYGHSAITGLLLSYGASVDVATYLAGIAPMYSAALLEIVEVLLAKGAGIDIANTDRRMVSLHCSQQPRRAMFRSLSCCCPRGLAVICSAEASHQRPLLLATATMESPSCICHILQSHCKLYRPTTTSHWHLMSTRWLMMVAEAAHLLLLRSAQLLAGQ